MQNERQRILQLVENGTISAEEAIMLLEALGKDKPNGTVIPVTPQAEERQEETKQKTTEDYNSTGSEQQKKTTGFEDLFGKAFQDKDVNKKMDEFMHDLKEDLSQFSNRMMNLMNTTVSKVKDFDFQFPFGEKVEFDKTYSFNADEVNSFEIDIPNGKLSIEKTDESQVIVETKVKVSRNSESEEDTVARFTERFVTLYDGKVTVATNVKMATVSVRLLVPKKQYDVFLSRVMNGGVTISDVHAKLLKVKTYNGPIKLDKATFNHANVESGNGMIEARFIKGDDIEAETVNGRIYIDGDVKEVEAESVNGPVTITTSSKNAHKIKATTVAGTVELYVPKTLSIEGQVTTNFGKADVGLQDVTVRTEDDQFLLKTVHFSKLLDDAPILKLVGETRTGSVIVRYNNNI